MRKILVQAEKKFILTVDDDAVLTFGPWSPPKDGKAYSTEAQRGTLRVYTAKKEILGVFSGVTSFRDTTKLSYAEEVVRMEGNTVWRDDERGYFSENKVQQERAWMTPVLDGATNGQAEVGQSQ